MAATPGLWRVLGQGPEGTGCGDGVCGGRTAQFKIPGHILELCALVSSLCYYC